LIIAAYVTSRTYNIVKKLSLAGMQLPEKYKENFDVSSETTKFSLLYIILSSYIPTNESLFILLALPTLTQTVQEYSEEDVLSLGWLPFIERTEYHLPRTPHKVIVDPNWFS
jgi:hypothetical protein